MNEAERFRREFLRNDTSPYMHNRVSDPDSPYEHGRFVSIIFNHSPTSTIGGDNDTLGSLIAGVCAFFFPIIPIGFLAGFGFLLYHFLPNLN